MTTVTKKKEKSKTPHLDQLEVPEFLEESHYINWFKKNGTKLLYAILILFGLTILASRWSSGQQQDAERDYITAEANFEVLQQGLMGRLDDPRVTEQALDELLAILKRRPELNTKYQAPLAQYFLNRGEPQNAEFYANRAFDRLTENGFTHYRDFASTALVLAGPNTQQAEQEIQSLQQQLLTPETEEAPKQTMLFVMNTLRLGMLEQKLGNAEKERAAWELLLVKPPEHLITVEESKALLSQLAMGELTLLDYLQERLVQLDKKSA